MKLGVPTLVSYELLDGLLESAERGTVKPSGYLIIDNGGFYERRRAEALVRGRTAVSLQVVTPSANLGVAASWNLILDLAGDEPIVIANDDLLLGAEMFGEMSRALERAPFVSGVGWALFGQTSECTRLVGPYDENFWPAYFEDVDYEIRLRRAGITIERPLSTHLHHVMGSTTRHLGHDWISPHVERNRRYSRLSLWSERVANRGVSATVRVHRIETAWTQTKTGSAPAEAPCPMHRSALPRTPCPRAGSV